MKQTLAELHFFPCMEYVYHLTKSDVFTLEACESFQKQSYRSRCEILGPNGKQVLNIPIIHGESRDSILLTQIDYKHNWLQVFWRSLEAAYKRSPYFDCFEMMFRPILFQKEESLFELNKQLLIACTQFLNIKTQVVLSESFSENTTDIVDLRNLIHPKKPPLGIIFQSYPQNFGETFVNNLSIIDLIMNEGPAASILLSQARNGN